MKIRLLLALLLLLLLPVALACGGDDDDSDDNRSSSSNRDDDDEEDQDDEDSDDEDSGDEDSNSSDIDIAAIDVCSALSEEDAEEVARDAGLAGGLSDYSFTATPDEYSEESQEIRPRAGCKFVIESSVVQVQVEEADGWDLYAEDSNAEEIDDLGDEAVSLRGTAYVRIDDVMLSIGENSTTEEFIIEIYRKMVPGIRAQVE